MKKSQGFLWADVGGLTLTAEDREILAHPYISGITLFSRNYESVDQLRELNRQILAVSPELVITVDQEGGRVQRFREGFTELPSMGYWGSQYALSPEKTKQDFSRLLQCMMKELRDAGVYSSLVPVLDINLDRNVVIGHRSFGNTPECVAQLAEFMIHTCHALRTPMTGKHFPGHGFVTVDSHVELPIDERSFDEVAAQDLKPFKALSSQLDAMMLAHIVYKQIDPQPVCFSPFWIQEVLRKQLQFDGLVMTDDLSMQAVAKMGSYDERAERALAAGADILLVCNVREGVVQILDRVSPPKNEHFARRLAHYCRFQ